MKYKIGVIGIGMVGDQIRRWFADQGFEVAAYDKFKGIGKLDDLNKSDLIFLCLPSAYDTRQKMGVDLSAFKLVVKYFKDPKMFVVKSTVPPGTTMSLQKIFPGHKFFHSPEFLTEVTAWNDFSSPHLQLLGYADAKNQKLAEEIIKILPAGKHAKVLPSVATEIFKYTRNAFFAAKVTFANQIYDLCRAYGVEYNDIKDLLYTDPWVGGHHLEVVHKDYRGFGGKCLPKDLKTLILAFKNKKVNPEFFEAVDKYNSKLLHRQKLTKTLKKYWLQNSNPRNK